jgi:hypothetical protein
VILARVGFLATFGVAYVVSGLGPTAAMQYGVSGFSRTVQAPRTTNDAVFTAEQSKRGEEL